VTHARGHADVAGGIPRDLDAPTVVIAHGAWIDATGWREVIALLQFKGVNVVAVQNPLTSLADDVDAVSRAINQLSVRSYSLAMATEVRSLRRPGIIRELPPSSTWRRSRRIPVSARPIHR